MFLALNFKCSFSRAARKINRLRCRKPPDNVPDIKAAPTNAPNLSEEPALVESFFDEFMKAPRSFLKLPTAQLIKAPDGDCERPAHGLLDAIRSQAGALVLRADTFSPVLQNLARNGSHEQAAKVILEMIEQFGVKPDSECMSYLALAYFNGGQRELALQLLEKIPKWTAVAQTIYKSLISQCLKSDLVQEAWDHFALIRRRCIPSPEITGLMLINCGKTGSVEKGMKLYRELVEAGMEPNPVTHAAMIYLCTRRKDLFDSAVKYYEQMKLLDFPIHLRVHNYMLQGCGKVSDVPRAIEIWNSLVGCTDARQLPNEITLSSILWTMASAEALECKISKRSFHYDMKPEEIVALASSIYNEGKAILGGGLNSYVANAYLAVLTNNCQAAAALAYFSDEMVGSLKRTEHSYELMFKMYDSLRLLEPTVSLKAKMDAEGLIVPFEGWRAMIRTAALCNDPDLAYQYLQEMTGHGYLPALDDLRTVLMRVCELRRFDLKSKIECLCLKPPKDARNAFGGWKERARALDQLFASIYPSQERPKLATAVPLKN